MLAVAAAAISNITLPTPTNYSTLFGVRETKITFISSPSGNRTSTTVFQNDNWTASYEPGKPFTITESLFTTSKTGITLVTNAVSNTPGFVFNASYPSFPAVVPYSENASAATQKIELKFATAPFSFSGVFEYTVYYSLTTPKEV